MWEQIRANQRKSAVLVVVMAALLFVLGYFMGEMFLGSGTFGLALAVILWIILTLVAYFSGDSIFLAMSGARKIGPSDHPVLYNIVEEMKIASSITKMPAIYIIDDPAPNAFATGKSPDSASVAVTAGLLERLNRDELQGVIAHELGHVKNRDVLFMMMVGVMLGVIVLLADIGLRWMFWGGAGRRRTSKDGGGQAQLIMMLIALVLMILAPIIAQMVYFMISRKREYLADASAVAFTRYPEGLASALEKISASPVQMKKVSRMVAPSYIENPLRKAHGAKASLFSTHPPIQERIRILRAMSGGAGLGEYNSAFKKVTGRAVGVVPFKSAQSTEHLNAREASEGADSRTPLQRHRDATDALWKTNDFIFIPCSCGTTLKIPPKLKGKTVACPHCGTHHTVTAA